jgi:hypothetical protein
MGLGYSAQLYKVESLRKLWFDEQKMTFEGLEGTSIDLAVKGS